MRKSSGGDLNTNIDIDKGVGAGRGQAGGHIRICGQQCVDRVRPQSAAAHFDEHTDDPPHHLPEEMRSNDADEDERAVFDDGELFEQDARRFFVRVIIRK